MEDKRRPGKRVLHALLDPTLKDSSFHVHYSRRMRGSSLPCNQDKVYAVLGAACVIEHKGKRKHIFRAPSCWSSGFGLVALIANRWSNVMAQRIMAAPVGRRRIWCRGKLHAREANCFRLRNNDLMVTFRSEVVLLEFPQNINISPNWAVAKAPTPQLWMQAW